MTPNKLAYCRERVFLQLWCTGKALEVRLFRFKSKLLELNETGLGSQFFFQSIKNND